MRFSTSNSLSRRPTAQDDKFGPFGVITSAILSTSLSNHCLPRLFAAYTAQPDTVGSRKAKNLWALTVRSFASLEWNGTIDEIFDVEQFEQTPDGSG